MRDFRIGNLAFTAKIERIGEDPLLFTVSDLYPSFQGHTAFLFRYDDQQGTLAPFGAPEGMGRFVDDLGTIVKDTFPDDF